MSRLFFISIRFSFTMLGIFLIWISSSETGLSETPLLSSIFCFGLLLALSEGLLWKTDSKRLFFYTLSFLLAFATGKILSLGLEHAVSLFPKGVLTASTELFQIPLFLVGFYWTFSLSLYHLNEKTFSAFQKAPFSPKAASLLLDHSALFDPRLLDLAATHLLDKRLILPSFILKTIHTLSNDLDESQRLKGKRALEVIKKLEQLPGLELRHDNSSLEDKKELGEQLILLAERLKADILTADTKPFQFSASTSVVHIITFSSLSHAMKPLMQTGEKLVLKIQRQGKEPQQGVGYLEDGTMVVVNNGGLYIGQTIPAYVISSKSTPSGRIIFSNAVEEPPASQPEMQIPTKEARFKSFVETYQEPSDEQRRRYLEDSYEEQNERNRHGHHRSRKN